MISKILLKDLLDTWQKMVEMGDGIDKSGIVIDIDMLKYGERLSKKASSMVEAITNYSNVKESSVRDLITQMDEHTDNLEYEYLSDHRKKKNIKSVLKRKICKCKK